jgi:MipA family protein
MHRSALSARKAIRQGITRHAFQLTSNTQDKEHPMKSSVTLALSLVLTTTGIATAQDGSGYSGSYTLGALVVPEFEGSDDYQVAPLLSFRLERENRWLELQGLALRANIVTSSQFEAGPLLNYRPGRDDDVEDAFVAGLPEIDGATELGLFIAYKMPVGQGGLRVSAELLQDVSGTHDGWLGTVSAGYGGSIGNGWTLGSSVSATLISDDYADTYFSTDGPGGFSAEGGLKDIGLNLSVDYALNNRSSVIGVVSYRRLLGDAADSPITQSGSVDQFAVGLGFNRKF